MAVRFHRFVAYIFAGLQALAGLFSVAAYADRSAAAPAAHASSSRSAPTLPKAAASKASPAGKRDAFYRAETKVLGDVARVVGTYKLTPPQRLAVMNYIGHSNRGLKIVSFGKSDGVEKFALKDAKSGSLLGVIGLRTTRDGAVIVDKATYAALDYKKYVSMPLKGKPDKKVAAHALKGSMELPLLQASLKKSKRAIALPGLRPIPGLDFNNARQCTARFNADGSGAEYCLVSKPATRVAGTAAPAAPVTSRAAAPAPVASAPAPVVKPAVQAPSSPTPAKRAAVPAAPLARTPAAPVSRPVAGRGPTPATVATGAALVGAVTYFTRPTVDAGGRQIESGLTSRYRVEDSLPHYEYRYATPAAAAAPKPAAASQQNVTIVNNETNVYEEETDVIEENTIINQQETEIVEVLPPEPGAPAGTDFTPVQDEPVVNDDDGIPETGGILPPEEPSQEAGNESGETPEFNPVLNQEDEDTGEGYGIPGLPGIYTGGPSDQEPDALKHDMEERDYENALDKGTPQAMDTFMQEHPDSDQADYERALQSDDPAELEKFVEDHPDSPEADAATNMIQLGDTDENPSEFDDQKAPENDTPQADTPTY